MLDRSGYFLIGLAMILFFAEMWALERGLTMYLEHIAPEAPQCLKGD